MHMSHHTRLCAFTLIELLVVIAIIGILMALLFPAVSGALNAAKKAQAKNDVTQIATAVIAFETEYGRLPGTGIDSVSGPLLMALVASNDAVNPRRIVFIETQPWKKGKGGIDGGTWKDPWKNDYYISMDDNYDNQISVSTNGATGGNVTLTKKVGVWNVTNGNAAATRFQVRSWD